MQLLSTEKKNAVLTSMMRILDEKRSSFLAANAKDCDCFDPTDRAMYDRLVMNDSKVDGMIKAVKAIREREDPIGQVKSRWTHDNGTPAHSSTWEILSRRSIYNTLP